MGWSLERWGCATLYEFNLAAAGYWKNWERSVAWLAREVNYIALAGNPHIKSGQKPKSPSDLYKLNIDRKEIKEKLSEEEITKIKNELFNGISKQSDSKDKG